MPNPANMQVSPDDDVIVTEIEIAAPARRVFQALIDPTQVLQWWGRLVCIDARISRQMSGREASGIAPVWVRTAVHFKSAAGISRSNHRVYLFTPGSRAGPAMLRP